MYHFLVFIALIMFNISECKTVARTVFDYKENSDIYWQALLEVAHGNKDAALKIVDAIRYGIPLSFTSTWQDTQEPDIDAFFDKLFLDSVSHDPQRLSELGLFESIGISDHNAGLTDISLEALLQSVRDARENLTRLKSYSFEELSNEQKISYKIFSWMLHNAVAGEKFLFHEYKINQMHI